MTRSRASFPWTASARSRSNIFDVAADAVLLRHQREGIAGFPGYTLSGS